MFQVIFGDTVGSGAIWDPLSKAKSNQTENPNIKKIFKDWNDMKTRIDLSYKRLDGDVD